MALLKSSNSSIPSLKSIKVRCGVEINFIRAEDVLAMLESAWIRKVFQAEPDEKWLIN